MKRISMLTAQLVITITLIFIGSLNAMAFSEDIIMVGTLNKGDANIKYRSKNINEFSLHGKVCSPNFIFIESNELRKDLLNLLGQQVMISGKKDMNPTLSQLLKENPSSQCLRELTILLGVFQAKKIQTITFYKAIFPEKVLWGEPLKFKLEFANPFQCDLQLDLSIYSYYRVYPTLRKKLTLSKGEKQEVELMLDKSNSNYAKDGTSVKLYIEGHGQLPGDKNFTVFFDDKIATYDFSQFK